MFIHFMDMFERRAPAKEFEAAQEGLLEKFLLGALDSELVNIASQKVPPGDINQVGAFRTLLENSKPRYKLCLFPQVGRWKTKITSRQSLTRKQFHKLDFHHFLFFGFWRGQSYKSMRAS